MRITRKWALTLFLIVSMLLTTPGVGVALAAGEATAARVDVTIAAGETAEVVIVMKSANLAGISKADAMGALKAQAAATQAAAIETVTANGGIVENTFWINNSIVARVDAATLAKLALAPNVDYIIPNFTVTAIENEQVAAATAAAAATPSPNTWGLDFIGAPAAWAEYGVNGTGVKIAVLDTGINTGLGAAPGTFIGHPDLAGKLFSVYPGAPWFPGGWMTWKPDGTIGNSDGTPNPEIIKKPYDSAQHGTHVSGTIVGGAASGTRIGVAPGAQLMMGLVLPGGSGSFAQVLAGMQWAIAPYDKMGGPAGTPADIVSMSLGATGYYAAFIPAIDAIRAVGCEPVMAIGNEGPGTSGSPGNIWRAMGIGAVDNTGTVGSFSGGEVVYKSDFAGAPGGWGAPDSWITPEFSAPGVGIMSSVPVGTGPGGSNYDTWNGTSMATPHVAGALALMIQYRRLHPTAAGGVELGLMFNALRDSAFDPPWSTPGKDTRYGNGIINVRNAISVLRGGTIAPKIEAIPRWPLPIKVSQDGGADFTLTINNKGTAPLSFNLTEQPVGGPAKAGVTTVLSQSAASAVPGNAGTAGAKASSYKYTASSAAGPRILVYSDDYYLSAGNTYVEQALIALGLSYTGFYSDPSGFNAALTGGGPWDLVLISQNNYFVSADTAALNSYVLGGGKVIIETFNMLDSTSSPLWATMGVNWVGNLPDPPNLYRWLTGDPVFNSPENIPDMVPTEYGYGDDGDRLDPIGGVEPLAGFTPSPGPDQSGIIRSSHGYVNSFIISDFRGDNDADGKVDALELWINEIANISGAAADVPWLSEDPVSGFVPPGGTLDVMVSVNAGGLGLGIFGAALIVNSDDPTMPSIPLPVSMEVSGAPVIGVSPMDPLTFVINKGEQYTRDNAFTIYNTGGGDLFVDISDQFAKGTSTSAGATGASNLPAPEAGPARSLPGNSTVSASAVKPSTGPGPDGRMFSGDKLNIGVSNFGELDWRNPTPARPDGSWVGYGFEYKPQAVAMGGTAESTAIGWNGEGYVVYYDGRAIAEYPDYRSAGIVPMGADILMDTPDTLRYRVSTQTDDAKLQVNFIITFNKHSRAVQMTTEFINIGPSFIGEIKYKRVVDWDAGASAGDDINWHYNSDVSILSTVDPPSGSSTKYYAYGFGAMGDSWPMVYDYDLNAWDDYNSIDHGSTWEQADIAGPFDGNVAMYFAVGPLGPGERKQVNTVYTVGEGADAASAYADMLTNLGGGKSGDVPWLNQTPNKPVVPGSGASGINVSVDGRGLAPGRYFANIMINHNDPGCPPILIPVQVVVNAAFKSIISDPEDVNPVPPTPPAPKMDINQVFVQLTKTSIQFNTTLYNVVPGDKPLVLMTMMDTGKGVGYTGPGSNDIMANYMLFGFIYPAGPAPAASKAIASADLSAYAKLGLSPASLAAIKSGMIKAAAPGAGPTGQLYLFKWDDPSKTWAPLMETYAIGMNSEAGAPGTFSVWQLTYLPLMYSDGSMKVVQSSGDMWELVDTAPDRGHGATVPARDIEVTGVDAAAAADAAPTFLTGQTVTITASVANNGDEAERDLPVDFQVIPVLGERATEPGEPGYPAPALTLGDPIDLGSSLIEVINPGDTGTASVTWTPELIAAAASRSKAKAAVDPWIHSYLLKASVAALPRETSSADNSAQTLVDVQVGVEVGLSSIWVDDFGPTGIDAKGPVDIVYTGMSYFVKVTVTNNGALDITDYEVAFIVDGNYLGSQLVSLLSGESADLWQEWTPDAAGVNMEIRAEGAVLAGEINPDDNAAITNIDVESGNDVAVNTLTSTPATPAYGNTVTFTATVANNGNLDLAGVTVLFDVNGVGIGMQSVDLAVGASATVEQTWAADQVGSLTARASISPLPYETNTANNVKTAPISVSGRDIALSAFTVTPPVGSPLGKKGKLHTVKVTVTNNGTAAETFQIRLTSNGTQVGTTRTTVTALAKGTSKLVTLSSWTPAWLATPPTFVLRAEVGRTVGTSWVPGLPDDINPDNDFVEKSILGIASIYDATVTGVKTTTIPMVGRVTPVSVTVANTGNESASFYVDLYADGALVKSQLVSALPVKASRAVSFVTWKPTATGNVELKAIVRGGVLDDTSELKTTAAVYVPVSLKLTSTPPTAKGQSVRIDVQLMDPTGKKTVALAGVTISLAVPAGVMATSATVTTDENGHAVLYVSSAKASAPVTITAASGLAKATMTIKF